MRIIALLLLGLALYFTAGLFWPARYEGPRTRSQFFALLRREQHAEALARSPRRA